MPVYDDQAKQRNDEEPVTRPNLRVLEGSGDGGSSAQNSGLRVLSNDDLAEKERKEGNSSGLSIVSDNAPSEEKGSFNKSRRSEAGNMAKEGLFNAASTAVPGGIAGKIALKLAGKKLSKRSTMAIGGGGVVASIVTLGFFVLSGPLMLIHISEGFMKNFRPQDDAGNARISSFYYYAKTGKIGSTRLSFVGNSVLLPKANARLAAIGVDFKSTSVSGGLGAVTVDSSKYPGTQGMSNSQAQAKIARLAGVDPKDVKIINDTRGGGGKGATFAVNTRKMNSAMQTDIMRGIMRGGDIGKITTANHLRTLKPFYNVYSWLHPFKKLASNLSDRGENRIIAQRKAAEKEQREKAQKLKTPSPETTAKVEALRSKMGLGAGAASLALGAQAGICLVYDSADEVELANYGKYLQLASESSSDVVAMGQQLKDLGKNGVGDPKEPIDIYQVGAVVNTLTKKDKDGNSFMSSAEVQATLNNGKDVGGKKLDDETASSMTDSKAKKIRQFMEDELEAKSVCSGTSKAAGIIGGTALLFLGPGGWLVKGLYVAGGVASMTAVEAIIKKTLDEEAKDWNPHEGALGGSIDAYGARELANATYRSNAAVAVPASEERALLEQSETLRKSEFAKRPINERLFGLSSQSLIGQIYNPTNASKFGFSKSALLTGAVFKNSFLVFSSPTAKAADKNFDWKLSKYAISRQDLASNDDIVQNADDVAALLESSKGEELKDRAMKCFGIEFIKDDEGWDVMVKKFVVPGTKDYESGNCGDRSQDWIKTRLFIFDTRQLSALACYEDDEKSCERLGVVEENSSTEGASSTAGGTVNPDDLGKSSDNISCAADTKDLGVVTSLYTGSLKKESGNLKVRLCQIPDIPGSGANTKGQIVSGGAVVDARVSGAWVALAKAAKADGVNLEANSSFRLFDSCGGTGDGTACARPGQSFHQTGYAIDFANGMTTKGTSTTSCSGRARLPDNKAWKWLYENADKFGPKQYTFESWHWDFAPLENRCGKGE